MIFNGDNYYNKVNEILAKKYGVKIDLLELLDLEVCENRNNDETLDGHYIEFPAKRDIQKGLIETFSEEELGKIPWGETEYFDDFLFLEESM